MRKIVGNQSICDVFADDVTVLERSTLTVEGIINGNIILSRNSELILNGILNGSMRIDENAKAIIYGIVNAKSVNCSGRTVVRGIVMCPSIVGDVVFEPGSILNGVRN
jgi:hypothetical protein